jgi:hypothetical protein
MMGKVERTAALVGIAFVAAMVLVAGLRLDVSVFAFAAGFVCGMVFGVPATVVVTVLALRYREREEGRERERRSRGEVGQPPVVVVPPIAGAPQLPQAMGWPAMEETIPVPGRRQFTVIGDDEG